MGVTNDVFPTSTDGLIRLQPWEEQPNDITRVDTDDLRNRASPIRFTCCRTGWNSQSSCGNWRPQPVPFSTSAQRGQSLFGTGINNPGIGCFLVTRR
jgi:hypothetical protein